MRKEPRRWDADDIATLIRLREVEGLSWSEIDACLRRPHGGSATKYNGLRDGKAPGGPRLGEGARIHVPADREEERRVRKLAEDRMTPTAVFFGDPPPGYSALDKRNGGVR